MMEVKRCFIIVVQQHSRTCCTSVAWLGDCKDARTPPAKWHDRYTIDETAYREWLEHQLGSYRLRETSGSSYFGSKPTLQNHTPDTTKIFVYRTGSNLKPTVQTHPLYIFLRQHTAAWGIGVVLCHRFFLNLWFFPSHISIFTKQL